MGLGRRKRGNALHKVTYSSSEIIQHYGLPFNPSNQIAVVNDV